MVCELNKSLYPFRSSLAARVACRRAPNGFIFPAGSRRIHYFGRSEKEELQLMQYYMANLTRRHSPLIIELEQMGTNGPFIDPTGRCSEEEKEW